MPKSEKPIIVERLFEMLWDPDKKEFRKTVVTKQDLREAKAWCQEHKGTKMDPDGNPFNFMKDIVRGKTPGTKWPESLKKMGIGGRQKTGDGAVFEFVMLGEGDTEDEFEIDFTPEPDTPRYFVQSLSLPVASKNLGRRDEPWLLQVAVNLRIVETHFAVGENMQIDPVELTHLQMDLKLRRTQIDALFLVHYEDEEEELRQALITVEAKQRNQRILTEQITRQVKAAFKATDTDLVIPLALAAVKDEGIYVAEFKAVTRDQEDTFEAPVLHRAAVYQLRPPVPGI